MTIFRSFSDEQLRLLVNLRQRYEVWIDAERQLHELPYDLRKKTVNGRFYLYEINNRLGNGTSLGAWDENQQNIFDEYHRTKAEIKNRRATSRLTLDESARLYRALRLPLLSTDAGPILREADRRNLLGNKLLVVGTNAIAAYMVEAAGVIADIPDETEDFDLAWISEGPVEHEPDIWPMLKSVDPTFTINSERDFQARNAKAYEVEILVAPSRTGSLAATDKPKPVPLPEQEWLLLGETVDQVIGCRDGTPARIVAPDPRWFALHKLWMAAQAKRNPLKRSKDRKQGAALLDTVQSYMPQYPLDAEFESALPAELQPYYAEWRYNRI